MKYIESTSLFNLHTVHCDTVVKYINSIQNVEIIDDSKLVELIKLVQEEAMIIHKSDLSIIITFFVDDGRIYISFEQDETLFPHLKLVNRIITIDLYIRDLFVNSETARELFCEFSFHYLDNVPANNYYRSYATLNSRNLLTALEKIDTIFEFEGLLFKDIYNYGLYGEVFVDQYDEFEITFSVAEIKFDSIAKMNNVRKDAVLSIIFKEVIEYNRIFIKPTIFVYDQELNMAFVDFLNSDNVNFINLIFSMFKINNVTLNSVNELKEFLLLEEMKNI